MDTSYELPGKVKLATGQGGLPLLEITSPHSEAHLYLHGAHVTHFALKGQPPALFMSNQSFFQPGKPIRGGVPVIFPWFGPRQDDPASPAHGFARTSSWVAESVTEQPDGALTVTLRLDPDEAARALWPAGGGDWVLRHRITVGATLTMELEIENRGSTPIRCEEALHTYFFVSDVKQIEVGGLEGAEYLDKTDGLRRKRQDANPIRFTSETDRSYVNTTADCVITDPGLGRRILVEKTRSDSTVVWNPWIAKACAMADFGDDEWPAMVCVETGNIADNTLEIGPGQRHVTQTVLRVESL